ncbi:MAG: metallophosphoesterase family protein [Bacteroidales bacterium]|nr:metallophosphoesterase family protein [Bacteroidales bacterium]
MKIGLITDIHENVTMLEAVLKMAETNRCDELACLGDIAGYDRRFYNYHFRRSARQCVALIRSACRWVVAGNHDLFAARRLPAWSNGFRHPENWFNMAPSARREASENLVWSFDGEDPNDLGDEEMAYLNLIPEYELVSENGLTLLLSHYICPDFTGSTTRHVAKQHHISELWKFMSHHAINYSLSGHSHKPFAYFSHRRSFSFLRAIHPVPNDTIYLGDEMAMILLPPVTGGNGRTSFSILDTETRMLYLKHEKVT